MGTTRAADDYASDLLGQTTLSDLDQERHQGPAVPVRHDGPADVHVLPASGFTSIRRTVDAAGSVIAARDLRRGKLKIIGTATFQVGPTQGDAQGAGPIPAGVWTVLESTEQVWATAPADPPDATAVLTIIAESWTD